MNVFAQTLALATPWAWMVPNHYAPWSAAWSDGLALALVLCATVLAVGRSLLSWQWSSFCALALLTLLAQTILNQLHFSGDAWVVACYLSAFWCAMAVGSQLASNASSSPGLAVDNLCLSVLWAALASVGIALLQWTAAGSLGIWQAELPPTERPFGNVAQPNHLCSISFLGLSAAGLLWQNQKMGRLSFCLVAGWMALGMVMSGSRTGWLQMTGLLVWVFWAGARCEIKLSRTGAAVLALAFLVAVMAWPDINTWLLLDRGRPLADTMSGGTRFTHWLALLDALRQEPLWGYGWQQVGAAQLRVAVSHPFVGEQIEYAHNLVLDLLIWNGLPLGLVLLALAFSWYLSRTLALRSAAGAWLLLAITGLGVHAMLEYPHTYAYFLVPLGLFVGVVDRLEAHRSMLSVSPGLTRCAGLALLGLLGWISHDYIQAEQSFRVLRMESAQIGSTGLQTPPPHLTLLNQLQAYQTFIHTEARPGMSPQEVQTMRQVAERYAYPPALIRFALVAGLNGQPEAAALKLKQLCQIHPKPRCQEGRDSWAALQSKYPVLSPIEWPAMP